MQANQKLSLKDRITAHLPGHKNQDNNMNGVPDRLEKSSTADRNGNGVPDALERNPTMVATDLNRNGIPDQYEKGTLVQPSRDLNGNGIPDALETQSASGLDLNRNGIPDALERRSATDLNGNGIPDALERSGSYGQTGFARPGDLNGNGIPDALERRTSFGQTGYTDLNRNGVPDQLEGQGFGFVGSVPAVQTSVVDVREAPVIIEKIEKPAVVHEVYKTEEVVQIQPVIEREREQLDVYEVVQPMREREVIATEVRQAMLPAQTRAVVVEDNSAFLASRSAPSDFSTREVAATRSQVIENAPIVHETIVHKVIEEVQPVIYKEVDRPVLIKETLPIYERIIEAPHAHHTVLPVRDLGVSTVTTTTSTGFTDLNRNGIPDQLERQGSYGMGQTGYARPGDLNGNGIPDALERTGSYGQTGLGMARPGDLNGNGIPDSMERTGSFGQSGLMTDLNRNGVPDQLEMRQPLMQQPMQSQYRAPAGLISQPQIIGQGMGQQSMMGQPMMQQPLMQQHGHRTLSDLNGNGIPDRMEKAHGLKDLNGNGVDDSLERKMGSTTLNQNTRV